VPEARFDANQPCGVARRVASLLFSRRALSQQTNSKPLDRCYTRSAQIAFYTTADAIYDGLTCHGATTTTTCDCAGLR
jgi:hypothetical protein